MDLILELLCADICYTVRRLLPADLKILFIGFDESVPVSELGDNPFSDEFEIVRNKCHGGIRVTPFLTYNRCAK